VSEVLGLVGVEQRVDKVDSKEGFVVHLIEECCKVFLACTWSVACFVGTAIGRNFNDFAL
jgi:hypothetical protein